jgi:thymidylate kinase
MSFLNTLEEQSVLGCAMAVMKCPTKKFIVFDGLIGAGKTTLITRLAYLLNSRGIKTCAIFEPVDIWNSSGALQYFYSNVQQHSYEFQTFTYVSRIKPLLTAFAENCDAEIFLLERSIWTDRYIFAELVKPHMNQVQRTMYDYWCDLWKFLIPLKPTKWIFLDTALDEAMRRIQMRGRIGEGEIPPEYQRQLYSVHCQFYDILKTHGENTLLISNDHMSSEFHVSDDALENIMLLVCA